MGTNIGIYVLSLNDQYKNNNLIKEILMGFMNRSQSSSSVGRGGSVWISQVEYNWWKFLQKESCYKCTEEVFMQQLQVFDMSMVLILYQMGKYISFWGAGHVFCTLVGLWWFKLPSGSRKGAFFLLTVTN